MEYEGGGEETRSNPWLAELQQEMFVEVNPKDASDLGFMDGDMVWVEGAEKGRIKVKAMVIRRVKPGMAFLPFQLGGRFEGKICVPNPQMGHSLTWLGKRQTPPLPMVTILLP